MSSPLERELYRAAARTFEELSFLLVMAPEEGPVEDGEVEVVASVAFSGPVTGRLLLGCPRSLLPPLAANMLGEEETPSELHQLDALMEAANVICGNLLPEIAGSEAVVRMEAPQVQLGSLPPHEGQGGVRTRVVMDEGWAEVVLLLDEGGRRQEGSR